MTTFLIGVAIFLIFVIIGQIQNKPMSTNNEISIKDFATGNQNIKLISSGSNKISLLKEIRTITGYGLKEAKDLIDSAPSIICKNIDDKSALLIKQKLETTGAVISIETNNINDSNNNVNN